MSVGNRGKWGWLLALAWLAGCGGDGDAPQRQAQAKAVAGDPQFLADNQVWRDERLAELRKPDGWTTLVGLHWLELKAHYIGSGSTSGIRLAVGPEKMGMVQVVGDQVWFVPEKGVPLTVDGKPLTGKVRFFSDHDEAPTVIGFDEGKGQVSLIQRGNRRALRVRHADAPTHTGFRGLDYWPADPAWRIQARFVPHDVGHTLPVVDITGLVTDQPNAGVIEFERNGQTYRLEAIGEPGRDLFVVFADRTSGHGSYAAGRFLEVGAPDAQGHVVVDFNRAYNPPCAFTDFATCPLPPPENRMDLLVEAGEKTYHHPD
ncbi:DUF1684 domain-containing protein [Stenotrophomonas sp. HITSZ_GD]|uniref:DUF1684 domain-containing protein n=1 Tax=Stenotrophomonas sp. HITSZ_GD TaxID=3037248 RepID=UPI00240D23CB|nr:DUF1684 domain-containing protein [Stenotrophomonas sp. HITSZ_GD]MDG2526228.1 DUF1684 domain-containing protein [Stenotrophomonas sp. HITSZ_GD]